MQVYFEFIFFREFDILFDVLIGFLFIFILKRFFEVFFEVFFECFFGGRILDHLDSSLSFERGRYQVFFNRRLRFFVDVVIRLLVSGFVLIFGGFIYAAQINTHCLGLDRKLRVHVERVIRHFFVVGRGLGKNDQVVVGLFVVNVLSHFEDFLLDLGSRLSKVAQQVFPLIGLAQIKIKLWWLGFRLQLGRRCFDKPCWRWCNDELVEVVREHRVIVEAHLVNDVRWLVPRTLKCLLVNVLVFVLVKDSPFDASVLDANVFAGELVQGLQ